MSELADVPVPVRTHFTHALVQFVAELTGIRVLHIKGPALHTELLQRDGEDRPIPRRSTDADILLHPADAHRMIVALEHYGARTLTTFETGSAFEHAATLTFSQLGYLDVHRHFPGVELAPEEAFELLWGRHHTTQIAHRSCPVPDLTAQRLILLLHAARTPGDSRDTVAAWDRASDTERTRVRQLAAQLQAEVALATAIGELEEFRDHSTYHLWHHFAQSGEHTRTSEWVARIRAASTWRKKAELMGRALRLNTDHLAMELGRTPTTGDKLRAHGRRTRRAVRELVRRPKGGG